MSNIVKLIRFEEGWRSEPYLCSEGYPTVGYGFKIGTKGADIEAFDFALPLSVGDEWLRANLKRISALLNSFFDAPIITSNPRAAVLLSMAYQMGIGGLLQFRKFIVAFEAGDYELAAKEMLDSKWARQTPERAARHAEQMRTGEWFKGYENA